MLAATRELMLLEWRPLPPEFENRERAITRLATISRLLQIRRPAAMRTLDCPGYVINREGRAALVYRFPSDSVREAPISLLQLLEDVEDNAKTPRDVHRPSLNDRYALALALAETVFRLHMSGWLHRCIGSHNVLFFPAEAGLASMLVRDGGLKRPFLTGFEFSREGEQDAATETVLEGVGVYRYRHPGCQGPFRAGFKKAYDLYGLGMTLLEVGLWKPFDRPPQYKSTISASENRDRILKKCLNGYLAHYTGNTFQAIVRTCLTGDFGCNASDDAALQQSVYDAVVEPLKWLVAGQSREPPQLTR
ncbi:hypothetical protein P154DRAFT_524585 [Amniculicola lignicola CBS 123094]|uniref:Protein kinase domain-containing protein n=1 Tax=Amniculicola lignicola CBS 123094 TaxID=1392246 RepID=A0A6A5W9Z9_9PLEO|nr:hypothetical protein P154DRAFT_524585 [Amniculicola lignicola CBS 123094]